MIFSVSYCLIITHLVTNPHTLNPQSSPNLFCQNTPLNKSKYPTRYAPLTHLHFMPQRYNYFHTYANPHRNPFNFPLPNHSPSPLQLPSKPFPNTLHLKKKNLLLSTIEQTPKPFPTHPKMTSYQPKNCILPTQKLHTTAIKFPSHSPQNSLPSTPNLPPTCPLLVSGTGRDKHGTYTVDTR